MRTPPNRWGPGAAAIAAALAFLFIVAAGAWGLHENRKRIAENSKTAESLCLAAAGARDFWVKVRDTTIEELRDPHLSTYERQANTHYLVALDEVIRAANGLAHNCDG